MTRAKRVIQSSDPAVIKENKQAQKLLHDYFCKNRKEQKRIAAVTGIKQPFLSRLANKEGQTIALETAILIDLATDGKLRAEMLCPTGASVIHRFLSARQQETEKEVQGA